MTLSIQKFSLVIPVYNEEDNISFLVEEINEVVSSSLCSELILVDDASTDSTCKIINRSVKVKSKIPLKLIRHKNNYGQSASLLSGIQLAACDTIITMDGDCQNDPRDMMKMLELAKDLVDPYLVIGHRYKRQDTLSRKIASYIARKARKYLLGDTTPDTGCSLKVFSKNTYLSLPYFDHMHRFIPALVKRASGKIISVNVNHRARKYGKSKYSNWRRFRVGIIDLLAVIWLIRRSPFPIKYFSDD